MRYKPLTERLAAKVDTSAGFDQCWPFTGRCVNGYGRIDAEAPVRRQLLAHRVAYALKHGLDPCSLPRSVVVRHACDNPSCCNPSHLVIGSQADNVRDMHERGRYNSPVAWTDGTCRNGHDVTDPSNVIMPGTKSRRCRTCTAEYRARRRAEVAA